MKYSLSDIRVKIGYERSLVNFMDITPLIEEGANFIEAYGEDYIVVLGKKYSFPLVIDEHQIIELSFADNIKDTISELVEKYQNDKLEVMLIGSNIEFNAKTIKEKYNLSPELMSRPAAIRTYIALLSEGRNVGLLLS